MTDKGVAALKPRAKRCAVSDPELRGHWVRIQPGGSKSFWTVTRNPQGKQVWTLVGPTDMEGGIEASREKARTILARVREGLPAIEPKAETFGTVAANWLKRHVDANNLLRAAEMKRLLNTHVLPVWRDREFLSIRRSDVTKLLDEIEDRNGKHAADSTLENVRALMNWQATRVDDYTPPIVRGMRRLSPKVRARKRVLTDDELRTIWLACAKQGAFGAAVRFCLLTAQRSRKVFNMRWTDLDDGVWTIARESQREKDTAGVLALPEMARKIIEAQPRFADNPHVFTSGRGKGPLNGFTRCKARLDRDSGTTGWVIHDLRRTARSMMSRAGVSSEHAERVMGHVVGGVEGIYNRHEYRDEKAEALSRLAALIDAVVNERSGAVVPMRKAKR